MKKYIFMILLLAFNYADLIYAQEFKTKRSHNIEKIYNDHISINENFAKELIYTAVEKDTEEMQMQFLLNRLRALNTEDLKELYRIIKKDQNRQDEKVLSFPYRTPWRVAYWICNYIDDTLGRLHYDFADEGTMGPIDSPATSTLYRFKPLTGHEYIVSVGTETLEETDGVIVSGYDWECQPNIVRLLLIHNTTDKQDTYAVLKISKLKEKSHVTYIWPQCK